MLGVLGVDAKLHSMAEGRERRAIDARNRLAGGYAQLLFDDIRAGDLLGHRVLNLNTGVHLHEVETTVLVEEELDGAGVLVARGSNRLDGRDAHGSTDLVGERRRRRFLEQLLMTALQRAIALAQRDAVAVLVGKDLTSTWRGRSTSFSR